MDLMMVLDSAQLKILIDEVRRSQKPDNQSLEC
jgi:hypothetical protein